MKSRSPAPANDAQLIQLVRTRLGREGVRDRINVSSCGLVITLHGMVEGPEEKSRLEKVVRRMPGVQDVVNKLGFRQTG